MNEFEKILQKTGEVGYVERIVHPIVYASGLPLAHPGEVVLFESGKKGQIIELIEDDVRILVFSSRPVEIGERIARSGKQLEIALGTGLLGKIVDPLGEVIGGGEFQKPEKFYPIQRDPPGIDKHTRIGRAAKTGVAMADLMVPIGRGQREMLMGGGNTGKSSFARQVAVYQARQGVICIFAAIGKKMSTIKRTEKYFDEQGVKEQVVIVASASEDSPVLVYLCPYTAMTIAEYFRDRGQDTLVILDDMSTHAKFYREISLLAGSFPGRESYPGDIFHVHAELLERAGNFNLDGKKEVSITCLPIVAMPENKFGYIQTNLISITDGHILFDQELFIQGRRPAINPYLSVTRVGHQAQTKIEQEISRTTLTFLGKYRRMQSFVRFGADLTDEIKQILDKGDKILVFFNQPLHVFMDPNLQVFAFSMVWSDEWKDLSIDEMRNDLEKIIKFYDEDREIKDIINKAVDKSENWQVLLKAVREESSTILARIRKEKHAATARS